MKVYKRENKNGQRILAMANCNVKGDTLYHAYKKPSTEKQRAFVQCREKYLSTPYAHKFRVCGANTFGFTVAWEGGYIDKDGVLYNATFVETKDNSYVVI